MAGSRDTPWAPSQYKGMKCACVDPRATECIRARTRRFHPTGIGEDEDAYDGEQCECCCHDRDIDEGWDSGDNEY